MFFSEVALPTIMKNNAILRELENDSSGISGVFLIILKTRSFFD